MLDSLNRSLQGTNFVNQNALAGALGNVQGFQNTDTSSAFFASGAVGPQAAAVFAGNPPAASAGAASSGAAPSTPPSFTINVNPATTATTATLGPQAPTVPTLQTAPGYAPNFGPSSNDLLTDEVNLTYQIYNLSLLLDRSVTDRTFHHRSRLQAVVGFDIDIEPNAHAKNAIAIVEVTASMKSCPPNPKNDPADCKPRLVDMMPEQGSHNAATLTQKANSFGGALAAQVFSVGVSTQKRKQVFYLYRDIDTLSFQPVGADLTSINFGWQFRPVLGRQTVDAGLRHMMAVLSLPAADADLSADLSSDEERAKAEAKADELSPTLNITVKTRWVKYESKTQSTTTHGCMASSFPGCLFGHLPPPIEGSTTNQRQLEVPITASYQNDLEPRITNIKWAPTDRSNGVAIVSGANFFLGTTVRFGNRTYTGANDGLTLKSDKEIEITLPVSAAVGGGVLSGRYGIARDISPEKKLSGGFTIPRVIVSPQGEDISEVTAILALLPPSGGKGKTVQCYAPGKEKPYLAFPDHSAVEVDGQGNPIHPEELAFARFQSGERSLNYPILSINGKPESVPTTFEVTSTPYWSCDGSYPLGSLVAQVHALVPSKDVAINSEVFTVTFPFEGQQWTQSFAAFKPALNIERLGSDKRAKLLISSTRPGDQLCEGWSVVTDSCEIALTVDGKRPPTCGGETTQPTAARSNKRHRGKKDKQTLPPSLPLLSCIGNAGTKLSLDIAASDLTYKRLFLVHRNAKGAHPKRIDDTRLGDIPDAKPKAPKPTLADGQNPTIPQYTTKTVAFKGTHLDGITSVLFDKTPLNIVKQDDDTIIVISVSRIVTVKPGGDQIQLLSDGNNPLIANLTVTPTTTASATRNKKP